MERTRFRAIEELFFELSELSESARAARLDELGRTAPDDVEAVLPLLRAHGAVGRRLEELVDSAAADALASASSDLEAVGADDEDVSLTAPAGGAGGARLHGGVPERIGPFRITGRLGEGGMGVVYRGERDDGTFEQQVAVKVVRGGLFRGAQQRFDRERRLLARLEHPGIARVIDGGSTVDGLPYLVMEHVDGEPIDRYADRRRLDVEARLRLFESVCRAVAHAHSRLIVHRDLKPSNILVSESGDAKLLDFGIAKLLEDDEPTAVGDELTAFGERVLTLEYASPEQVRGEPVTVASDVFSLGVVLYRLLSGERPFARWESSRRELERAVCEVDPDSPSAVTGRLAREQPERAAELAMRRGTSPRALQRRLAGDLDAIVLRALRKEPSARYASVSDLLADLERRRGALPVLARQGGLRYRVGRFLRRYRVATLSTVAVLLALTAGLIGQQRAAARAERSALEAAQVSDFLTNLFEIADPDQDRGNSVTAREILDEGVRRIRVEMEGQPLVRSRLLHTMGAVYRKLGLYDEAEELLLEALDLRRSSGDGAAEADSLVSLAQVRRQQGRGDEAVPLLEQALALRTERFGSRSLEVANVYNDLGLIGRQDGLYDEARKHLERALELRRELSDEPGEVAVTLNNLGLLALDEGRYAEARDLLEQALEMKREALGEDHPSVALGLGALAGAEARLGNAERATELRREAVARLEPVLGPNHAEVGNALNALASSLHDEARYDEAEPVYLRALAIAEENFGELHHYTAQLLNNLAWLYLDQGEPEPAEPLFRQSLRIRTALWGENNPDVARAEHNLASLLVATDREQEAEPLFRRALATRRATLRAGHPEIGATAIALGNLLMGSNDDCDDEALALTGEGLEIFRESLPPDHLRVLGAMQSHGACLLELGRITEASDLLIDSQAALEAAGASETLLDTAAWRRKRLEDAKARGE